MLWSLRTPPNAATQETSFFLVHNAEAVLLGKITCEAPRISDYKEIASTKALEDDVDALDEARDIALAKSTTYQQNCAIIIVFDYVPNPSKSGIWSFKQDVHGKLESPWLGPYIVTEVIPGGAYRLRDKKI
jgi:hypothetical protein